MTVKDCICDARFSGMDEAEYCARGCPSCTCHLTENSGYDLLMEVIQLGKAGKPYQARLLQLKQYISKFPKLADLVRSIK